MVHNRPACWHRPRARSLTKKSVKKIWVVGLDRGTAMKICKTFHIKSKKRIIDTFWPAPKFWTQLFMAYSFLLTLLRATFGRPGLWKNYEGVKFQKNMQIMTPFCIFPIDTGDKWCPLGNIAWLTLQSALKSWKFINELGWIQNRMGKMRKCKSIKDNLDMTVHLHPGMRCRGLESPASHKSSCHVEGCQGKGTSCLKSYHQLAAVKRWWHLWGSSSIDKLYIFFFCRLDGSSNPYAAKHCIGLSTTQKHSKAGSLVIDLFVLQSGWFPPWKASHSLQYSLPRDKARLPRLSSFLHSWLQVHRWPAPLCCPDDNNWQSLIRWWKWRHCQRSQPTRNLCFLSHSSK